MKRPVYLVKFSDRKYCIDESFIVFTSHQTLFRCSNQETDGRRAWHLFESLELHTEFWWRNQDFCGKSEGKELLGSPKLRWKENNKTVFKKSARSA